jgi:hypothetical protein
MNPGGPTGMTAGLLDSRVTCGPSSHAARAPMVAIWPDSDERHVYCGWCGALLTDGERFLFELDQAGYESGRPTVPDHPGINTKLEPIPTCTSCRVSATTNYDEVIAEREAEGRKTERAWQTLLVMFLGLLVAVLVINCIW